MFGDLLGKNLNRYRIEKQIGAGGMGVAVIQEAEKKGILGVLYEARLALGKAEMKHGNKEDGRARLAEVERIERSGHLPSRQLWRYAQDPSGLKSASDQPGNRREPRIRGRPGDLGSLSMQQGDLTAAQQNYEQSIKLRNEIGEKSGAAEVSLLLGSLSIEEGNPSQGEALARKALEEFRAAKISELQISAHAILAQALLAQGKLNLAQKEIAMGKPLAAKTQQRVLRSQFEIAAAEVLAASGKPADLQAATASLVPALS